MINNVVIACCDEEIRILAKMGFSSVFGEYRVKTCSTISELHKLTKYVSDTAVIFDKYFLGYVISYEIIRLKFMNKNLVYYFIDKDDVSHYFGMRIYELGAEGFIPNIENSENFKNCILKIQNGMRVFPDSIQRSFKEDDYLLDKSCISEVTFIEMEIGIYLSMGLSQKQICYATGLSKSTVSNYIRQLKRKIGYSKPGDLAMLYKSYISNTTGGNDDN